MIAKCRFHLGVTVTTEVFKAQELDNVPVIEDRVILVPFISEHLYQKVGRSW